MKIFRLLIVSFFVFLLLSANYVYAANGHVIDKGDKLTIRVQEQEALNNAYTVYNDGEIEFPYITEPIKAEGLTYDQLAQEIKKRLEKDLFYKATVTVTPFRSTDFNSSASKFKGGVVYVYGMAARTGVIEIPKGQSLTVSQVIIRSGGFQDFANRRAVKLVRKSSITGKSETKVLNMVNIIDKGKTDKDVVVQDGDTIVVPEQFFNF